MRAWRSLCGADEVSTVETQSYMERKQEPGTYVLRMDKMNVPHGRLQLSSLVFATSPVTLLSSVTFRFE